MSSTSSNTDKLRIIVVFRRDLEMPPAKAEVQFGHAVDGCIEHAENAHPDKLERYRSENRMKLSMEVEDEAELWRIMTRASERGVPHYLVTDAGHTVFGKPTVTCIGLGPMSKTDGNSLTRKAKMRT